jgi:hypothetical protein
MSSLAAAIDRWMDRLAVRRPPLHGLVLLVAMVAVGLWEVAHLRLQPPAPHLHRLTMLAYLLPPTVMQSPLLFDLLRGLFAVASLAWLARRLLPASAWMATLSFLGAVSMAIESSPYTEHHHHTVTALLAINAVWFTVERQRLRAAGSQLLRRAVEPGWMAFAGLYYLVITHTLAGLTKLRHAGLGWASGTSLQLWLHEELVARGRTPGAVAALILGDRRLAAGLQVATLVLETLAVLACLGDRLRRTIGVGLLLLHLGIEHLFGFEFHGTLVAVVLLMIVRPHPVTAAFADRMEPPSTRRLEEPIP